MAQPHEGPFYSEILNRWHEELAGEEPDAMTAFPTRKTLLEHCTACDNVKDDLYQICLKCCNSSNCMQVTKLFCHSCGDKISSFYNGKVRCTEEQHDIWLFHLLHKQEVAPRRPTITHDASCGLCKQRGTDLTVFTSRCCNESGALERKTILCQDCLKQKRVAFLKSAADMPIPDFSTYMFHLLTC